MIRVVIDTNILVSAFINPRGAPAQLFRLVLSGDVVLCADGRILDEYYEVLRRPRFAFPKSEVDDILAFLDQEAEKVAAPPAGKLTADPFDQVFIDVALAARAQYIITGNLKHFKGLGKAGVEAVSPLKFLELLRAAQAG